MAVITQTAVSGQQGAITIAQITMSASDTLSYASGTHQKLMLENTTGSSLTATIIGSSATTVFPTGLGGSVSVAAGYPVTVAAGATKIVDLDTIAAYLSGNISVTGAATMTARLFT